MKIIKFQDFETTNENLKSSLSIIGLLIGLGIGKPEIILANQEKIEQSIDQKEKEVLEFIDSLQTKESDTIFDKELPITFLTESLEKYNYRNFKSNLKIDDVIKTTQNPIFPIKIDMFFVLTNKQVPITTIEYQYSDKIVFTFRKNGAWGRDMLGIRVNF